VKTINGETGLNEVYEKPNLASSKLMLVILLALVIYLPLSYFGVKWAIELMPDQLSLSLFGLSKTVSNLKTRLFDIISFAAFIIPAVVGLELALAGWKNSSLRRLFVRPRGSVQTDWVCFFLGQAQIFGLIGKAMTFGLVIWLARLTNDLFIGQWGLSLGIIDQPLGLQIGLYFILYTFFDYWSHRFYHTPRFWPLHRFHHSAREFTMLTTFRQHPVDFLSVFVINLPLAMLGATVEVMLCVSILVASLGMLIHSNIDSSWGFVGRYLIQSPNHHRLHHVLDYKGTGVGHFGIMPVWDHLFGSWIGDEVHSLAIGVDREYGFGINTARDIVRDYKDAVLALFGQKYKE
jgi:sterol desaturase/sphingolipid hydroxylase (fatty acid hydroxylase superfamily)